MRENFTTAEYFDLRHTKHAELFSEVKKVWEVLEIISDYIQYALEEKHFSVQASAMPATFLGEQVAIGEGTVIEPGAVIKGPALIGANCTIRSGAYLRENVIIGDNCIIGNSTEIKNSLLFNQVSVPHYNYVGDCVLGYKVHLGAGVILSNIKTPPSAILVATLDQTFVTGLIKFGAIIGDQAEIGCNAVLNPGTIIGKHCLIYPLALIRGVIPHSTIVKVKQQQEIVVRRRL